MSFAHSSNSSSSKTTTNVNELNLQDTGGYTVADNTGSTINLTTTDSGAIQANSDVSKAALDLGGLAVQSGAQVANHGLDNARAAYESGLTFGTSALDTVRSIVGQTQSQQEQLVSDALAGYQSIAQQNSASNSSQLQRVAMYAIAALVLILVVPKVIGE